MSDHPDHDPGEATRLIKAAHRQGGHRLTDLEVIEFIAKPILIPRGHLCIEWSGNGRKPTKTRHEYSAELRRGHYHKLVRLPANRPKAKATRYKAGDVSRRIVQPLVKQALKSGTPRRGLRKEVMRLAAAKDQRIPADWQLGKIIAEFLKVNTTTR